MADPFRFLLFEPIHEAGASLLREHGVGLDTIDLDAAAELGIRVVCTPEGNSESVTEHFVAMALALSKRMFEADRALRAGRWQARHELLGGDLGRKTLGVIGFGRIGRATARICHRGFAMPVLYHGPVQAPPAVEGGLSCAG